jgi:DNA polymerase II large subunit
MALCDTVEGPIVELDDGSVVAVHDASTAEEVLPRVTRLVDLGELLVPFGEFLENNHALEPGGYSLESHLESLRAAGAPFESRTTSPTYAEAVETSRRWAVPLHPRFNLFWHDLSSEEIRNLSLHVEARGRWVEDRLYLPVDSEWHELLLRLGVPFAPAREGLWRIEELAGWSLLGGLGLETSDSGVLRSASLPAADDPLGPLELVSRLAGVEVRPRSPTRVGARIGRPEKARQRKMSPNVHTLFPVGDAGGPQRSVEEAARKTIGSGVPTALGTRKCTTCGQLTIWTRCACGGATEATGEARVQSLPIAPLWATCLDRLQLAKPPHVKGVKGLTSKGKVPERLEKGILRAAHGISVYQDGTARFDMTDLPLTHFRPREVGLSVERAIELGYTLDVLGEPVTEPGQLLELRVQDLIVSTSCGRYLTQLAQFVDDELVRLYGLEAFYRVQRPPDLIGQIVVALAPHTSGGVAGRIVGFTEGEACFAHPLFHAAKRRNCDGDEDSVTLLLDALLNFSRAFLPDSRGALMDKPLVLTTRVDPREVDKEAHNVDIGLDYPVAMYRAADRGESAKSVEPSIDLVGHHLEGSGALEGYGFTHDTQDIAGGPVRSAYREAGSMARIVEQSLRLTAQLRSVDVSDAVTLVLNSHFLPDLMGNLKSYATQRFRCKSCGASYRRPPLLGRCGEMRTGRPCGGELVPTVFEGAVRKYLGLSQRLAQTPGVTPYVRQRIQLLESSLATLFPGSAEQTVLDRFATPAEESPETS